MWSGVLVSCRMRHGISLIELLVVLTMIGLLSLVVLPATGALRDRLIVESAARAIVDAHVRARLLAVTERRVMLLDLGVDSLVLRARISPVDSTVRWRHSGPAADGVTAVGMPWRVQVAPSGIPFGVANNSYTLTRGSARRQVVVSRYGRIQLR